MRWRFSTACIFFAGFFSATPGMAEIPFKVSCENYFRELETMAEEARGSFLTAEERRLIQEIYESTEIPQREKAPRIFTISLEARLRHADPEEAQIIRDIAARAVRSYSRQRMGGSFSYAEKAVSIYLPKRYRNTIMEFYILGHELEHAIQYTRVRRRLGRLPSIIWAAWDLARHKYLIELGAMRAERAHVANFPLPMRKELAELVKSDRDLQPQVRKRILRVLNGPELDVDTYVAREQEQGRYSFKMVQEKMRRERWGYLDYLRAGSGSTLAFLIAYEQFRQHLCEGGKEPAPAWCSDPEDASPSP